MWRRLRAAVLLLAAALCLPLAASAALYAARGGALIGDWARASRCQRRRRVSPWG